MYNKTTTVKSNGGLIMYNKTTTVEEWLGEDNKIGIDIWNKKYRYKNETFYEWLERVSGQDLNVMRLIYEKKFLFGGRTLTNRGTGNGASYSNCYSSGYAPDSVAGMLELNKNIGLTYKAQGGQGISMSKVRPKGTPIGNTNYKSDGIVPFMEMFNQTTDSLKQGGSRKGALMISLSCWHKEIGNFINIKSSNGKIEKANLSVEVDDEFMEAVNKYFETGEIITVDRKEQYEDKIVEYTITPIEIYKLMMQRAYDWAEPGVIYTNRFRNYNIMEFHPEYNIITSNPCGEQPLPPNGACNLGSANLAAYVKYPYTLQAEFDMSEFLSDVSIMIRAMDDVLEEGKDLHPLHEQREMTKNYRNIGLGIMGLGDTLFKLGMKYGSEDSKKFLDNVMLQMFKAAVLASNKLAKERGVFPKYSPEIFDSTIIKNHFNDEEISKLREYGIRNCSLLSIAPTGSIGTMLDVSTGMEPAFAISYNRKTESLHGNEEVTYKVYIGAAKEYLDMHGGELPDYFITSADINWRDRVDMQSIAQKHVDTAISSTVNLKKETTLEEIEKLYLYAWKKGLKGITIFRDGSKKAGILTTDSSTESKEKTNVELGRGFIIGVDDDLLGRKKKIQTGCGTLHVQAWVDPNTGEVIETFIPKGSGGGCNANITAISKLISIALRGGIPLVAIQDQLTSIMPCSAYTNRAVTKGDTCKGNNCPSAIINAILELQQKALEDIGSDEETVAGEKLEEGDLVTIKDKKIYKARPKEEPRYGEACPECGEPLEHTGGCMQCPSCFYSKCE